VAFRRLPALARSQEAYDRFSAATDLPLTLLAVLWLPVLVVPLVTNLPASVVRMFNLTDLVIWLLYAARWATAAIARSPRAAGAWPWCSCWSASG
jgi:hypothetical protein